MNERYNRQFGASPKYTWKNTSQLSASASTTVDWGEYETASKKYLPFNFTRIINNGEADIWFYPNQDSEQGIFVPHGVIISISREFIPALWSFTITNDSSSTNISANKIVITGSNEGQTSDSVIERLHKRLVSPFLGGFR